MEIVITIVLLVSAIYALTILAAYIFGKRY